MLGPNVAEARNATVLGLNDVDKQKLEEVRQLAMSMTSHPVAFGTIEHTEKAGEMLGLLWQEVLRLQCDLKDAHAELERLRAENAALKRDLQYARDGLTKGRTRMREDNERLAREAHTWSKAAENYAADAERMRAVLKKIEAGEYLHLPTMVREALGPNAEITGG